MSCFESSSLKTRRRISKSWTGTHMSVSPADWKPCWKPCCLRAILRLLCFPQQHRHRPAQQQAGRRAQLQLAGIVRGIRILPDSVER
jgi:hypothetical protein